MARVWGFIGRRKRCEVHNEDKNVRLVRCCNESNKRLNLHLCSKGRNYFYVNTNCHIALS